MPPASGKGLALRWDEDGAGDGGQPGPGRRTSWQAPRELRGPRPPQDPRSARPPQEAADRAPRAVAPEHDPRQATPRPRPAGTAATGQHPVARTRETGPGPTGTAQIPVVRQPGGPAAPRPGQREQMDARQPEGLRPGAQQRSRLRTPPPRDTRRPESLQPAPSRHVRPAAPQVLRPPQPFPQVEPTPAVRPFSQLTPVAVPLPPPPSALAPEPVPTGRRGRPVRGLLAVLAVLALAVVWGLPSFASEALDAPPVAGIATDGVQSYQVGDVHDSGATADSVSGAAAAAAAPVVTAPAWMAPVAGHLGDPFGPRPEQPVPGVSLFHRGQDIIAPCGTQIHAAASGTVTTATWWGTYGNWILIDHGDGVAVGYAHESQILVSPGQRVHEGQVIGLVGETGAATGCHLHLEVHMNGVAINPVPFFAAKHISLG